MSRINMIRDNKVIFIIGCFLFCCLPFSVAAQKSKTQLEKEKSENLRKITETQRILQETENRKETSMGQLQAINEQIKVRQDLIKAIEGEITLLNQEIDDTNEIIESLNDDLDNLKEEYASMVYAAYKADQGFEKLIFIFSASSFNQFMMRLKYMEQYGIERKNQVKEIEFVTESLLDQLDYIRKKREQKNDLLNEQITENQKLTSLNVKQKSAISSLAKKESQLRKELAERKTANERLEKMIATIIAEEIRKSSASANSNKLTLTPEAARLSESFAGNAARLPWPVESGFISRGFGEQPHPILKRVKTNNKGVYIQTKENEQIRAVFDGVVTRVIEVPGMNYAALVRHGEYMTVYANLRAVDVKPGQQINIKDPIGTVFTDAEGISEIYFQVWKNNDILNPQSWLSRK